MKENRLTACGAAAKLGVNRTTLWRFCDSGKALSDTRDLYRKALDKRSINTETSVSDVSYKTEVRVNNARTSLSKGLAGDELKLIRKACEGVLILLDAYEAQGIG